MLPFNMEGVLRERSQDLKFHICLRPEAEGGYTVMVPALPGCITWGRDLEHARSMAKDAIELYIESLTEEREPIPDESQNLLETIEIEVPIG